jgi:hypothetical protein
MYLNALDAVGDEELPPTVMHVAVVRQKLKIPLDYTSDAVRLGGA